MGGCTDPSNHRSFEEVWLRYDSSDFSGIGFVLTNEDDLFGVDCDKCVESINKSGEVSLSPGGKAFVDFWLSRGAYLEISPSGKGLRGFLKGTLPEDSRRKTEVMGSSWEIYGEKHYLTVTGIAFEASPTDIVTVAYEDLCEYRDKFMGSKAKRHQSKSREHKPAPARKTVRNNLSDEDQRKIDQQKLLSSSFVRFGAVIGRIWMGKMVDLSMVVTVRLIWDFVANSPSFLMTQRKSKLLGLVLSFGDLRSVRVVMIM